MKSSTCSKEDVWIDLIAMGSVYFKTAKLIKSRLVFSRDSILSHKRLFYNRPPSAILCRKSLKNPCASIQFMLK
jgi:hypothetical protein